LIRRCLGEVVVGRRGGFEVVAVGRKEVGRLEVERCCAFDPRMTELESEPFFFWLAV
jgi:hypothetical protein